MEKRGPQRTREVIWTMAEDGTGRVWIQSIRFADAKPNSYGVYNEVIDSGILTSKPLEYSDQSYGVPETHRRPFNKIYEDITPLLDILQPIKKYREARGILLPPK